jgi:F-type H+-transporting ATPase subunit epsilon
VLAADKNTIALEVCAIDRAPVKMAAVEVEVPGVNGPFTVLPGHAALLSLLEAGVLTVKTSEGVLHTFALGSGFARVMDNHVLILAQTAEIDSEIDIERARAAKERAEERLRRKVDIDEARAQAALHRALVRLQAIGGATPHSTRN